MVGKVKVVEFGSMFVKAMRDILLRKGVDSWSGSDDLIPL